jgi:hypothetical protein
MWVYGYDPPFLFLISLTIAMCSSRAVSYAMLLPAASPHKVENRSAKTESLVLDSPQRLVVGTGIGQRLRTIGC